MVRRFKKRFVPKRRFVRKSGGIRKLMGSAANTALTAATAMPGTVGMLARGLKMVKDLINVETKFFDAFYNATVINTSANPRVICNQVVLGDDYNNRSGRSILSKSLTVKMSATIGTGNPATFLRVVVVADKKPDTGTPQWSDVYALDAGGGSSYMNQINKQDSGDRFVVLKDHLFKLDSANQVKEANFQINLTGTHVLYDGNANAYSDFEKNAIFVIAISNRSVTDPPTLSLNTRYRFHDN